jgi:4-hydroxymandelate oxidase
MTLAEEAVDLSQFHRLADFETAARAVLDPAAYDYIAGGSWDEESLGENEAAWRRRTLRPRVLVDVADVTTATTLLGVPSSLPVAIAPTATHGLAHPDGETATARAAAAAGIPFILSTMSSRTIEEVAEAIPDATRWFQLYVQAEPRRTRRLVERAIAAGYSAIVLTVDLPVLGYRERDRRNDFVPGPFGNFADPADEPDEGVDWLSRSLTWEDLATIRGWAPGLPLVLKGILGAEDARLAVEHGADAIVVSNHGARQLDRVAAPVDVLEEVVDAVRGGTEIWVDGGVRRGLDVAIALALGARGVLIGRPALWALATGGQAGVERAIAIIRAELEVTLALLGAPSVADVTRAHVANDARGSA